MTWGHDQLQEDLAAHLRGSRDRIVWTNMQLGPSGSPRPDVFTVPKSYSKFRPIAYECKISTADFRRDVTSGKWQSYLKYASGVIFAAPAGLIKKEDVPNGCGLIVRHDEVWRTLKGPTLRAFESLPHEAWMKLMIDGLDRQNREPQPRSASPWQAEAAIRKKYGDKIGGALRDLNDAELRLQMELVKTTQTTEQLREAERERAKHARQVIERELAEARTAKHEICQLLGLPDDAAAYLISRAATEIVDRLNVDEELKRVRRSLELAQRALADGLKPLPALSAGVPQQQACLIGTDDPEAL
ncbi:hypothetical protein [Duganella sp. BJB476]|uniref:hypothetical protein n=1 Tax=Duganella sp. BJB476 TaxID=1871176 RepID=UPI0018F4C240|nr:hypothetical protein [Duganella sp. BJB476]